MSAREETPAELARRRRELLERLLREEAGIEISRAEEVPRRSAGDVLRLSFPQQRLWFLDQLHPGSVAYNIPVALRLEGSLDGSALERSLQEIVHRHEALRTSFALERGLPVQVIASSLGLAVQRRDLRSRPPSERVEEALRIVRDEAGRSFDLSRGPLVRAGLVDLAADDHVLWLVMHHIVADGWSVGVLVRELTALYGAFSRGEPSPLPELPIQYADFALWQRKRLDDGALIEQERYWREQLGDDPPGLQIPADRPRPSVQSYSGRWVSATIPPAVARALRELSREEEATLFMTLLAGFQALLHRYTSQEEFLVGTPEANRGSSETGDLIGYFANTLVLRADLHGAPAFRELLRRVREATLGAYAHRDLPFERLVEALQPERDTSRQPLFQVAFVFQNAPVPALDLPGLELSVLDVDTGTAKFDLTLSMSEAGDGLAASLEYSTDLFDESTAQRMLGHLGTLLEAAAREPDRPVGDLPLLTDPERLALLEQEEPPAPPSTEDALPHRLFEDRAAGRPGAVAVTCGEERVSYGELNARANRLARCLKNAGVGSEVRVGLFMERSIEMVVAILGILKAGGAYVPLDLASPKERREFILDDAGARFLLTERRVAEDLPARDARVVLFEEAEREASSESGENLPDAPPPGSTAYVIYTSGSTGLPKGVPVAHASVTRLFSATRAWFGFGEEDVWTLFHSISFDFSVWELWGALLHGGRLVVVPYADSRNPESFRDLLGRERVTVLNQTPSAFRQLSKVDESAGSVADLALRFVIFGGEALDLRSLAPWLARRGDRRPTLVNMYGITETTVHVTYRPIAREDLNRAGSSFIGAPIPDLRIRLVDSRGHLVPIGVPGEILVGGAGVARGYLNRPDLTAERFVPDPFSAEPGARLYRSGDLARRLPDGDLEYLGRADHQVKVRGFRVEPAEIEAALEAHPSVRESVVILRGESGGDRALAAYFVPEGEAPAIEDLRAHLKLKLPEYMVPAQFVAIDALPLTAHGKVDRKALPEPGAVRPDLKAPYEAPRSEAERGLAEVWSGVLGVDPVGVHDNFFAIGGDSIRSIQVRALALERGLDFSIEQLFRNQTIAELACVAKAVSPESASETKSNPFWGISEEDRAKLPDGIEDAYPLSQLQAGFVFHSEISPDYIIYATSIHLKTRLEPDILQQAVDRAVRRHPILRTSFDMTTCGEPVQIVHREAEIPIRFEDLTGLPEGEEESAMLAWVDAEMKRRFDWSRAPLVRIHVHRRAAGSFQFTVSEPFFDGWSVASLITEIFADYFRCLEGGDAAGEPAPVSTYRDFVKLERETLESDETRRYWASVLGDCTVSRLPRGSLPSNLEDLPAVCRIEVPVSPETSRGLRDLALAAGVPLKSALLAAHLKVIAYASGQTDILTGLISNGRPEEADGDRVLGIFLNTVPLRLPLHPGTWADLAREAFEAEREMLPHRRFPMAELQRVYGAQPLFDSCFNFTNFHVYDRVANVEGLEVLNLYGSEQTYFALTAQFNLDEETKRVTLGLDYRTAELGRDQAEALAGYYERALAAMASNSGDRHEAECLLSPEETHRLLVAWNDTASAFEENRTVHGLFEACADRVPHATALVDGAERLTYEELNRRSNRLAHHLRRLGVGVETPVAFCLERTWRMIVAILGILKSGGTYVPLDPAYPEERISITLGEARAPVLLTEEKLAGRLPVQDTRVVCLDSQWQEIEAEPGGNPGVRIFGENLAYVLYTSGSTGRPKGAAIRHRGIMALLGWATEVISDAEIEGYLASTSLCFDPSVLEIFLPLARGGKVIVADSVLRVPELPAREEITMMSTVSSAIDELLRLGALPASVRTVTLAGEPLRSALVRRVLQATGISKVWNLYGLTEDTVYTTAACLGDEKSDFAPIGRPVRNTRVYLLDEFMQPVPEGVPGELYIGGEGLPRGYLGRPELTAAKFVPDPFVRRPGSRLHRTGDLARRRPDGNLEFVRRIDFQVKVRGFRVELGEIETVLAAHAGVRKALAVVREDSPGAKRIVAYVVPASPSVSTQELRRLLKKKLPDYMVPSFFVILEALPLTPNGKIDRKALPPPDSERPERDEPYVAPRSPAEETLAGIWSSVLRVEKVGVHDNFFELGGHSLLATQVVSRARDAFGTAIPLPWLFEAPTVLGLAAKIEGTGRDLPRDDEEPIGTVPRDGELPLSFAQRRLWFLDQLEPGTAFYNVPLAVRLSGRLDVGSLNAAFTEILRRHEALRTTFAAAEGRPVQVIHPAEPFSVHVRDLAAIPGDRREEEADRLAAEEARRPFDLERGPLFRAELLRLASDEHLLLATMHHIVSDGWSIGVLIREFASFYEAFRRGERPALPELPVQYADFAAWQQQWLQGEVLAEQVDYWKARLAGCPEKLDLPTDQPRPPVQTYRGSYRSFSLGCESAARLRSLCRDEDVTPFMALLASFQALLQRYSGEEDIVVGTPIANRNRSEIEGLIGFFVNTLAMRTNLSGDPTFRRLLARVRETAVGAYAHQDLPFERLVEILQPRRDLAHAPIFQVMFDLQNLPDSSLDLAGVTLAPLGRDTGTAKFDLTLTMAESPDDISGTLEYNTDLFEGATIDRMIVHFQTLLAKAISEPDRRLSQLDLMAPDERNRRLEESSGPRVEAADGASVWDLFRRQAELGGERDAVVCGSTRLTYDQLGRKAGRLARRLADLGVGPEVRVALDAGRAPETLVGMLAVMAAGGAYVPLDPEYPAERLALMTENADPGVLLVTEDRASKWPANECRRVLIDGDSDPPPPAAPQARRAPRPDNAAYVIYTSGSTGTPKGVVVSHANLAHSTAAREAFYAEPVSRFLLLSSFSFDSSVAGIFWTLCHGGALHLVPEGTQQDPRRVAELLDRESISHLLCLPSFYNLLLDEAAPRQQLRSLKTVVVAGEVCPAGLVARHRALLPEVPLFNEYGPTEATVWCSVHDCATDPGAGRVPIGRPVANTRVLILDAHGELVPEGIPGEIHVGGGGVARGYLDAPHLTAERFVPDPYGGEPGSRLYRTGDWARALPGGAIEFLGRRDAQVKVRGFRIELGDVEAALQRHPSIREAAVVARQDGAGSAKLVAYMAKSGEEQPTLSALRTFLKRKLPDYMVPSLFVFPETWPLTPGGKVDRAALPDPGVERPDLGSRFVEPRDAVEEVVAGIWAGLLGVSAVGAFDDFFELGGHSLLATQAVSRIREAFQIDLPLRSLFEAPSVAGMGEVLTRTAGDRTRLEKTAELFLSLVRMPDDEVSRRLEGEVSGGREAERS